MHAVWSILTVLAVLLQAVMPAGGCVRCAHCNQKATATTAEDSAAACCQQNGACGSSTQIATPVRACCSTKSASNSIVPSGAPAECCQTIAEQENSVFGCCAMTHTCECCVSGPEPLRIPTERELVSLEGTAWLEVVFQPLNVDLLITDENTAARSGSRADDRTRPHRSARCHLLDCCWLI